MIRWIRYILLACGAGILLLVAVFALGWMFMPRDWIEREAQAQASRMSGGEVRWRSLEPAFQDWALGVKLRGLTVRMPAALEPTVDARVEEVFIRMRLLPLLFRRVEVSTASVKDAWVTLVDRGARAGDASAAAPPPAAAGGAALILPRLIFTNLNLRTRDPLGGGTELKRLSGHTEMDGAFPALTALRIDVKAESLYWKPSAREADIALPGPFALDAAFAAKDGGKRLEITKGSVHLGPIESVLKGAVLMPDVAGARGPELDFLIEGKPQGIRSDDKAWKQLAAKSPAAWKGTASWLIRVSGAAQAPATDGRLTVKPLSITAGANTFALDRIEGRWSTQPDQTFTATAQGDGDGVTLTLEARGSTAPGGAMSGVFFVRAPAKRLNGLVPNAPTWDSGDLDCRAIFELRPPAPPTLRWVVKGRGLNGTVQGLAHPVKGLGFDVDGDMAVANVRSLSLTMGSTTAHVDGTVKQEKPLGTGTFHIVLDRFVAEEWAPPTGAKGTSGKAPTAPQAPPPIPLRALNAILEIGEVRSGTMQIRNLVAPIRFQNSNLSVAPITGAIGTGTLQGGLDVASLIASPSYTLHLDVKRAPVEEFISGMLPFRSSVSGFLNGVVDLKGPGLPGPEATNSLVGSLTGSVEEGRFLPSATLSKVTGMLGLNSGESGVSFKQLTHSIRIAGGRMLLDKVRCELGADLAEMNGSVGLDHSLDVNLLLRLAPSRVKGGGTLAEIARYARDEQGRVPLELKITGTDKAPVVSIKPGKAMEIAGKRLQQKLGTELAKQLADSRPDSARTDSTAADPMKKGREALRRFLGK